jgi:glutaredoxin-related protein
MRVSRAVIQVLGLMVFLQKMRTYDVSEDPELRSGIKEFSCVMLPKSNVLIASHC